MYLILTIAYVSFFHNVYTKRAIFNKYSGFTIDEGHIPYKISLSTKSDLMCLAQCNQESNCLTAHFNKQIKTCSLFNSKITANNLSAQSSSVVFTIKSNYNLKAKIFTY
jgi:hypothetical protein